MNEIATQFVVPPDHPSLAGHFPGHPIVPGVVLLDAVLEAIQVAHGAHWQLHSIVSTKFLRALEPSLPLDLNVSFSAAGESQWKARFVGRHAQATVLEGSLLITTGPPDEGTS